MEKISHDQYPSEPVVLDKLSIKFMKQSRFVPLYLRDNTLGIAMADPDDFRTIDALQTRIWLGNLDVSSRR
jgi:general secretion pathway protein E